MAGIDYSSLPMGANPETDQIVGYTEFGEPIRRARFGGAEYSIEQVATGKQGSAVKEAIKHPLDTVGAVASGVAGSIWNGLQTPGRAARGETITNGDLTDTLGLAAVGPVGGTAPQGALRSGLSRTETSQQILDMLKGGKAADITDDMLSAADAQYLYQNYDLPMDAASRMQRAQEMGFKIKSPQGGSAQGGMGASPQSNAASSSFRSTPLGDASLFHATDTDVNAFQNSFLGSETAANVTDFDNGSFAKNLSTLGHWTSDKPLARDIGRSIDMPVVARGKFSNAKSLDSLNKKINRAGGVEESRGKFDGVRVGDEEFGGMSTVVYDPANIRSRFARFDPRLKHLPNLSAGVAGAGVFGSTEDNKAQIRAWLEGNQ